MPENKVCAVVVTFHPSAKDIQNLTKLRSQVETLVVVDNGSSEKDLRILRGASQPLDMVFLENGANLGIAAVGEKSRGLKIRMFTRGVLHGFLGKTGRRVEIS